MVPNLQQRHAATRPCASIARSLGASASPSSSTEAFAILHPHHQRVVVHRLTCIHVTTLRSQHRHLGPAPRDSIARIEVPHHYS